MNSTEFTEETEVVQIPPSTSSTTPNESDAVSSGSSSVVPPNATAPSSAPIAVSVHVLASSPPSVSSPSSPIQFSIFHFLKSLFHHPPHGQTAPLFNRVLLSLFSFLSGVLLSLQAGANVRTSSVFGHTFRGSLFSNGFGSIFAFFLAHSTQQFFPAIKTYREKSIKNSIIFQPRYKYIQHYFGGICGALYVCLSISSVEIIGFSVFFIFCITGQIICSLIIDYYGYLDYPKRNMNIYKWIGVTLTIAGSLLSQDYSNNTTNSNDLLIGIILSSVAGVILPIQAGINKQFLINRLDVKYPFVATFYSYISSVGIMIVVNGILLACYEDRYPLKYDQSKSVWWQWFGGLLGLFFVIMAIVTPPVLGIAPYFVSVIAGQLLMSVVSDSIGIFGPPKPHAHSAEGISGVIMAFLGASLIAVAKGKERIVARATHHTPIGANFNSDADALTIEERQKLEREEEEKEILEDETIEAI